MISRLISHLIEIGHWQIGYVADPLTWTFAFDRLAGYKQALADAGLRTLAEETGGIAIVNQNDFDKGLKRIDAETSDYYVLGYYSSNPDPLRKTRKIEVRTKRDGVTV